MLVSCASDLQPCLPIYALVLLAACYMILPAVAHCRHLTGEGLMTGRWQAGSADISLSVRGSPGAPTIAGTAALAKGCLQCPYTKYPLTNVGALVRLSDKMLQVRDGPVECPAFMHATSDQ